MLMIMALTALFIVPAMAADVTIPMNKDYKADNNMVVHLIAVNITDYTMGNEFTPYGKDNTIWPKLMFTYTNTGSTADTGHLLVLFHDDQGNVYNRTDVTMNLIQPGQTSEMRFLEVPVQKDRKVTEVEIVEGFRSTSYAIQYPAQSSTTPVIPGISNLPDVTKGCCLAPLLLPLLAIGAVFVSKYRRK
jgi:hypothetical protein